jgi:hypothetical protein
VAASGPHCYRIDEDRMIEINDSFCCAPVAIRNEVSDLISFQFVSTVKRSEFLGQRKNVHDLGPAIIVSAVPRRKPLTACPRSTCPSATWWCTPRCRT